MYLSQRFDCYGAVAGLVYALFYLPLSGASITIDSKPANPTKIVQGTQNLALSWHWNISAGTTIFGGGTAIIKFKGTLANIVDIGALAGGTPNSKLVYGPYQARYDISIATFNPVTLIIKNVQPQDAGEYAMALHAVTNGQALSTEEDSKFILDVLDIPEIDVSSSSSNTSSWNGHQVTLTCKAIGVPTPTFEWFSPNGNKITNALAVVSGGSQVVKVTTENSVDYGQYKCRATNRQGSDERSIYITQRFPPGPPVVSIHDIKAASFTLKWIPPANNGGSAVIDYKVEVSTKTPRENIIGSELLISELDKDTEYTVRVFARNVVGYGTAGRKTIRTKKQGRPSFPILKSGANETTDTELLLQWSKPDENGGIIKKYMIYSKVTFPDGKETAWRERHVIIDGSVLEYNVKCLETGRTYSFLVTATNEHGESAKDYTKAMIIRITKAKKGQAVDKKTLDCNCTCATIIGVGASIIALLVIVIVLLLVYIWRRGRRENNPKPRIQEISSMSNQAAVIYEEPSIPLSDLNQSTALQATTGLTPEYEPVESVQIGQTMNDQRQGPGNYASLSRMTSSPEYQALHTYGNVNRKAVR